MATLVPGFRGCQPGSAFISQLPLGVQSRAPSKKKVLEGKELGLSGRGVGQGRQGWLSHLRGAAEGNRSPVTCVHSNLNLLLDFKPFEDKAFDFSKCCWLKPNWSE